MKPWIFASIGVIIALTILITSYYFTISDSRGFELIVEVSEPYPDQYLPISEIELLGMPTLLFAMNETGVQKNLTQEEWQNICDFLGDKQGVIEFHNEFFFVQLLRI
jgi:hypothetical protein